MKISTDLSYQNLNKPGLTSLPIELFEEICKCIPPSSLYSLTLVCHRIRNLLWSSSSSLTQRIWRISRQKFHPTIHKSITYHCTEQEFIWKVLLHKKCQFCGKSYLFNNFKEIITIGKYWPFQVNICVLCVKDKTNIDDTTELFQKDYQILFSIG
ncbi:17454_t:CDS:2 [Funneliformis caledonium]|uniref:17454_t:CDS:1 n=1 Tax=Funneliformis caledonium TaxID=1117310 RepID=A0A9N9FU43_9GLOM|nr:17454_t:CDS:2 [Funneliformis caledonium]